MGTRLLRVRLGLSPPLQRHRHPPSLLQPRHRARNLKSGFNARAQRHQMGPARPGDRGVPRSCRVGQCGDVCGAYVADRAEGIYE